MKVQFEGIWAPLTTPFSSSGEICFDALERNVEKYLKTGLEGFLVAGSTGEAAHLDLQETLAVVRHVAAVVAGKRKIMVGLSVPTLQRASQYLEEFQQEALDAVLVSVPSYYKNRMNEVALTEFYTKIADLSPFPTLLYNIPRFSGVELGVGLVGNLARHENIAGLKESSGNLIYLQEMLDRTRGMDFEIVSGSAETYGLARLLGVRAGILAISCAVPDLLTRLATVALSEAREFQSCQRDVCRMASTIVRQLGIPGVKYAMDIAGFEGLHCRAPLLSLTAEEKLRVETVLGEGESGANR